MKYAYKIKKKPYLKLLTFNLISVKKKKWNKILNKQYNIITTVLQQILTISK